MIKDGESYREPQLEVTAAYTQSLPVKPIGKHQPARINPVQLSGASTVHGDDQYRNTPPKPVNFRGQVQAPTLLFLAKIEFDGPTDSLCAALRPSSSNVLVGNGDRSRFWQLSN